jgi:hypothetical protein
VVEKRGKQCVIERRRYIEEQENIRILFYNFTQIIEKEASNYFFQSGGAKSILDILKMSILQKVKAGWRKKCDFPFVTIMLSFPFFDEIICDANFFHNY